MRQDQEAEEQDEEDVVSAGNQAVLPARRELSVEAWERIVGVVVISATVWWAGVAGHWQAVDAHRQVSSGGNGGDDHPSGERINQLRQFREDCIRQGIEMGEPMIDQVTPEGALVCDTMERAMGMGE